MDGFLVWATAHYWLAFLLGFFGLLVAETLLGRVVTLVSRFYRLVMVLCRGWPPAHLDADGDWRPEE